MASWNSVYSPLRSVHSEYFIWLTKSFGLKAFSLPSSLSCCDFLGSKIWLYLGLGSSLGYCRGSSIIESFSRTNLFAFFSFYSATCSDFSGPIELFCARLSEKWLKLQFTKFGTSATFKSIMTLLLSSGRSICIGTTLALYFFGWAPSLFFRVLIYS